MPAGPCLFPDLKARLYSPIGPRPWGDLLVTAWIAREDLRNGAFSRDESSPHHDL